MRVLTCEVCGGHRIRKESGIFVCQDCGCQYDLEEAKALLIDVPDTVDVVSVAAVSTDSQETVHRYVDLAARAFEARNMEEAESYGTRALELDGDYWDAWYYKGAGAGWCSTRTNIRLREMASCFDRALSLCNDSDALPELKVRCSKNLNEASVALVTMLADSFAKVPDQETRGWISDALSAIDDVFGWFSSRHSDVPIYCRHNILSLLHTRSVKGYNKVTDNYRTEDLYTDELNMMYFDRYLSCLLVCRRAQSFCPENDFSEDMVFYDDALSICSTLNSFAESKEMKKACNAFKVEWVALKQQYLERNHNRAIREYWANHGPEKSELESKVNRLNKELDDIIGQLGFSEQVERKKSLTELLSSLEKEEYLLYPFGSRSKQRAIRERISDTKSELKTLERAIGSSEKRANDLSEMISKINARLQDPIKNL